MDIPMIAMGKEEGTDPQSAAAFSCGSWMPKTAMSPAVTVKAIALGISEHTMFNFFNGQVSLCVCAKDTLCTLRQSLTDRSLPGHLQHLPLGKASEEEAWEGEEVWEAPSPSQDPGPSSTLLSMRSAGGRGSTDSRHVTALYLSSSLPPPTSSN